MRVPFLLLVGLSACQPPPAAGPSALVWPAKLESSSDVTVFAVFDAGTALARTEVTYALGDEYPSEVVLVPSTGTACDFASGKLTWSSIGIVSGEAASATLVDGSLKVTLNGEGVKTLFLEGTIDQQNCPGGLTVVPVQHRVVITVHRVASLLVTQSHSSWPGCEGVVLPGGAELYPPVVHPVNAAGLRFAATNAPSPAELKLNSTAALTLSGSMFTAAPGHVTISVATSKTVNGLESFEVVGPESITSMEATLQLRKAVAKGWITQDLVDDRSYELLFPDEFNSVDVRVGTVVTSAGQLCAPVPLNWFDAQSSTPEQCAKTTGDRYGAGVPVAKILAAGECRLDVTVPKSAQSWSTRFSTTRP